MTETVKPATVQQMRASVNSLLELGWKEAAQALDNAIELMEIEYRKEIAQKNWKETQGWKEFVADQLKDNPADEYYMLEAARLGLDTGEPSQDGINAALSDVDMDTPARARLTFREVCETLDGTDKPADWMLRAYRDMQMLPAPIAVNVPSFVGVVYHV